MDIKNSCCHLFIAPESKQKKVFYSTTDINTYYKWLFTLVQLSSPKAVQSFQKPYRMTEQTSETFKFFLFTVKINNFSFSRGLFYLL